MEYEYVCVCVCVFTRPVFKKVYVCIVFENDDARYAAYIGDEVISHLYTSCIYIYFRK
jgi:hypothetical protein